MKTIKFLYNSQVDDSQIDSINDVKEIDFNSDEVKYFRVLSYLLNLHGISQSQRLISSVHPVTKKKKWIINNYNDIEKELLNYFVVNHRSPNTKDREAFCKKFNISTSEYFWYINLLKEKGFIVKEGKIYTSSPIIENFKKAAKIIVFDKTPVTLEILLK